MDRGELAGAEQVGDSHWLVAARAPTAGPDPAAPRVALVTALLTDFQQS
jgi:hypothetical protein